MGSEVKHPHLGMSLLHFTFIITTFGHEALKSVIKGKHNDSERNRKNGKTAGSTASKK